MPTGPVGPFQLQAAIAAVHAEAARAEDTDWAQVDVLYGMLEEVAPGPVVTLNHAVAVAMVHGPQAGLDLLDPLLADPQLRRQHRIHAVRAHLLEMAGRAEDARQSYAVAARLATSIPEQRYLNGKARPATSRPASDARRRDAGPVRRFPSPTARRARRCARGWRRPARSRTPAGTTGR